MIPAESDFDSVSEMIAVTAKVFRMNYVMDANVRRMSRPIP
jgi:hypothetical protein